MERLKKIFALLAITILMVMTMPCTECRNPVLHRVGGGQNTWAPNVNFTEWATQQNCYVGDWLYFGFDKQRYNVLQVNKTSYERCIDKDFINNITRGGRDVFNLTEAKPYYFLSGGGYCLNGMKVAVYVRESPPDSSPSLATSPSVIHTMLVASILLSIFFFSDIYIFKH